MFFITTQPDHKYYEWQIEAQLYNFYIQLKYEIPYICLLTDVESKQINVKRLQKKYKLLKIFYFKDHREFKEYHPSIQPFLLKKFFHENEQYRNQKSIIIDADVIFTKKIDFSQYIGNRAYLSNTDSYLNYRYIKSKGGDELFNKMCEICSIQPEQVKELTLGGAQYIFPSNNALFWSKVESDSINLYKYLQKSIEYYKGKFPENNNYHPIQIWTASMWAIFYNIVYFKLELEVPKNLDFCWPTDHIDQWENTNIYHNAGVTESLSQTMFFKGGYINNPPTIENIKKIDFSKIKCSIKYGEILKKALVSLKQK